jgi:DNA polymerase-3 subunit epsilon
MHTDMAPVMRSAFENIIAQESLTLTEQFEALAAESRSQALQQSCHVDIYSADLTSCLQYRCIDTGTSLTETAPPLWIHADSLLLLPALDFLLHRILDFSSASQVNIEVIRRDAKMYLDLIWQGDPVPAAEIESWRDQSLADMSAGNITMAEVLERHNSDIWSKRYSRPGWSLVRMPLPISSRR